MTFTPNDIKLKNIKFDAYASVLVAIIISALLGLYAVELKTHRDVESAKQHFIKEGKDSANTVAKNLESSLNQIYQNIRTISYLPSIRSVDRHAENLKGDPLEAVQHIYNNLANAVSVSEVYVNHISFDPGKIDAYTKKAEGPIIAFDSIIVGRNEDKRDRSAEGPVVEEIEDFEYHLIKDQIDVLKSKYPVFSAFKGLHVPAISGREVITCDNSRYSLSRKDDADRSGIVYSVPFYDPSGAIKGSVSAIMLTDALRDLLPDKYFALVNKDNNYTVFAKNYRDNMGSELWAKKGEADPDLIFSTVIPIDFKDASGEWKIWAGYPNSLFYEDAEYKSIMQFRLWSCIAVSVLGICLATLVMVLRGNFYKQKGHAEMLNDLVKERTAELESIKGNLENVVYKRTAELRDVNVIAEKARKEAEKANHLKSEFLKNVASKLRAPIYAIKSFSKEAVEYTSQLDGASKLETLNKIKTNAENISKLLDNILDFSELEKGLSAYSITPNKIFDLINDALREVELAAKKKNITINLQDNTEDELIVECDEGKIHQVLLNLLTNSVRLTSPDKNIFIEIEKDEDKLKLSLLHEGVFIPKSELETMFDKVTQSCSVSSPSYGECLELAVSKEIIEGHKGKIWAENVEDKASKFIFTIPLKQQA